MNIFSRFLPFKPFQLFQTRKSIHLAPPSPERLSLAGLPHVQIPSASLLKLLDDLEPKPFPSRVQPTQPWPMPVKASQLGKTVTRKFTKEEIAPVFSVLKLESKDYIQVAFEKFHSQNPEVYEKLKELSYLAMANGHERIGIGLLWERLRYYYTIETKGDSYRLDNNHRSRYARLLMKQEPALEGFFKIRTLY